MSLTKSLQIADAIHGSIRISQLEKAIISTEAFNRLHNIHQTSTAYLTYPSNQTNRFAHSLGVMHLGGKMLFFSIANANYDVLEGFFSEFNQLIDSIIDEDSFGALLRDRLGQYAELVSGYRTISLDDPLYKTATPANISKDHLFLYTVLYQAVRCAALLHDVGHPPFSHVTEAALKEIYKIISLNHEQNERMKEFIKSVNHYSGTEDLHETIGIRISSRLLELVIRHNSKLEDNDRAAAEKHIFYMLVQKVTHKILTEETSLTKAVHKIISGPIDCDRLDYVTRDLVNSGFDGRMAYDKLVSSMRLLRHNGQQYELCPDIRGLSALEEFFNLRWHLYKYVIYHHRVIKTDELLKSAIVKLALQYLNQDGYPCGRGEDQVGWGEYALPLDMSGLWKALQINQSDSGYFNPLFQWDDAWLITVLRQLYFARYHATDILNDQLEELLSNRKKYFSIIKRKHDFLEIDKEVVDFFAYRWSEFERKFGEVDSPAIDRLRRHIDRYQAGENEWRKEAVMSGLFTRNLQRLIEHSKNMLRNRGQDFDFEDMVRTSIRDVAMRYGFKDCMVVFKTPKPNSPVLIYRYNHIEERDELIELNEVSTITEALERERELFPLFFLYTSGKDIAKNLGFKRDIGHAMAQKIWEAVQRTSLA